MFEPWQPFNVVCLDYYDPAKTQPEAAMHLDLIIFEIMGKGVVYGKLY